MKPSHPGGVIKDWILPEGITITKAAKLLGVSRQSLDALVNERRSVTPEMAIKIETVFGSTAKLLMALQISYDLYQVEQRRDELVSGLEPYTSDRVVSTTQAA